MPRPKATKAYPSAFMEYAHALTADPTLRIEVEFESGKEAKTFRLDFPGFKQAAMSEGLDNHFPELPGFSVEVKGARATVLHKDHTPQAERMRKALREAKSAPLVKGRI